MGPGPLHCSISLERFVVHGDFFLRSKGCKLVGDKGLTPTFPEKSRFLGSLRCCWGWPAGKKTPRCSLQERTGLTRACCPLPGLDLPWCRQGRQLCPHPACYQGTEGQPLFCRGCAPRGLAATCNFFRMKHTRISLSEKEKKKKKVKDVYFPLSSIKIVAVIS